MKSILTAAVLAALALPAAAQSPQPAPGGKFGFVHTERILRDSIPAQRAQKKIEAEFQKRDRELAGIADQLKRMQDGARQGRDDHGRSPAPHQGARVRRPEPRIPEKAARVPRGPEPAPQRGAGAGRGAGEPDHPQIAEQEKFDIIFQEMPAYVSPRIDITDKVIKALEGKPPVK